MHNLVKADPFKKSEKVKSRGDLGHWRLLVLLFEAEFAVRTKCDIG